MGSARQSFEDLFSSTENSYVHFVDTVYEYTNLDKFTVLLAFDTYLNTYMNPTISKVDKTVVQARINKTEIPSSYSQNWEGWQHDTVQLNYDKKSPFEFTPTPSTLLKMITSSVEGLKSNEVARSHSLANSFMDQVMFSLGKWKYMDLRNKLVANYNKDVNYNSIDTNLRTAILRIGNLIGQTHEAILAELKQVCANALDYWVNDKSVDIFLLTGLVEAASFEKTMIRNALRDVIYKNLYLTAINEPNDAILQYMKRILADMFIVCFYPYIHFLYASQLQNYFIKRGDFINMRAATSAKIMITINTLEKIRALASGSTSIAPQDKQLTTQEITQIENLQKTLNDYFDNLTNPIFEEPNKKFGDIDVDVRNLAKDVREINLSIDDIKKWIQETQLQIRSHNNIYKGIGGILQSKKIQYILHIIFVVVLLIVIGVLLTMNLYLDIAMYALVAILVFFIMVRLVALIISLL